MTGSPQIRTRQFRWTWQGQDLALGVDEAGTGPTVLPLPALISILTRREMRPLMQGLANRFFVIAPDWPGFGDLERPPIPWTPDALSSPLGREPAEHAPGAGPVKCVTGAEVRTARRAAREIAPSGGRGYGTAAAQIALDLMKKMLEDEETE